MAGTCSGARCLSLVEDAPDALLIIGEQGDIVLVNAATERMFGYPRAQLLGLPSVTLLPEVLTGHLEEIRAGFDTDPAVSPLGADLKLSGRRGDGTEFPVEVDFYPLRTDSGLEIAASVRDVSGRTRSEATITGISTISRDISDRPLMRQGGEFRELHDTLTGLPNRELLANRLGQALRTDRRAGTRTGLLVIDLNRFKEVNNTFGYKCGDDLLRQVGPRIAGVLRDADSVACLGGDEFAVLLPNRHGVDDATMVALELAAALGMPFHVDGVDLDVEARIGVVISGEHGQDATTLLQHANIAMGVAKTQPLGVFTYDPAFDSSSPSRLALLGDLRRALARDELVLHYQPKVSLSTGEVVGVEALVRWQHPERGLIFPDDFIPMAEFTALIGPLTQRVLDTALAQARTWIDAGKPLPIAVNLSARNLLDEHLADRVAELLAVHDVPAALLELEVTESAIMTDPVKARQVLEQLSALGVRISIDDFGAGYTSLSQLTTLPLSELKIDRSFVMRMIEDPGNAIIVQSVIDLGHNLDLTLVAEGVETEQALMALAGLDCDVAQGYHLCRPVPVADFDIWCAERTSTIQDQVPHPHRAPLITAGDCRTFDDRRGLRIVL